MYYKIELKDKNKAYEYDHLFIINLLPDGSFLKFTQSNVNIYELKIYLKNKQYKRVGKI